VLPSAPAPVAPEVHETTEVSVSWVAPEKGMAAEGDANDRVSAPTLGGAVGLFRTLSGEVGRPRTFRVGLHLGGFAQSAFLVAPSGTSAGDRNSRFAGDLTLGYTPWKYLEVYLAVISSSNQNNRTDAGRSDPQLILSLGDLALGLKGRYPIKPFWDLALHAGVRFASSAGGFGFDGGSTRFAIDLASTWDLRNTRLSRRVPLRFHLNFGYLLDRSVNSLLPAGQCAASTGNDPCIRSRVVESFAYGVGTDRLRLALAADAPVMIRSVGLQPMLEYHVDIAVGSGDATVLRALAASVPNDRLKNPVSQWLTLGLRLRPVAGLVIDAGIDVGVQSPGFGYGSPLPAWNLFGGASYAYDFGAAPGKTKVVEKTRTREIARGPVVGKIRGVVRDAATRKIVAGAVIHYVSRRETPQMSAEDGSFVSYGFQPGPVRIEVSREDYDTSKIEPTAFPNGETAVEVLLTPRPPAEGQVRVHVADPAGAPVAAVVRLKSSTGHPVDADPDGAGSFVIKRPAGEYALEAVAPGFLARQRQVTVQAGQVQSIELALAKKPAASRVALGTGEITVKGVIHFGTSGSDIRPDGEQLLDEVVDLLIRNPQLKRVRVEGHTDNRGEGPKNLELSRARARAVMSYLSRQGVDPLRLESEGYGAGQPLVPNITPANRARNRRVAFKIVD
jgi:outer membrane protein OmpA-like peptidoglycan-associated protein